MKSFVINRNDSGQRLDKYLQKSFPNLPKSLMYKYIRLKRIKRNGKRTDISERLQPGDVIDLYINDEFFEKPETIYDFMTAGKTLDIIYEDENILLLNKKVGLLCHPDDTEYIDTLIGRIQRYLYEKGEYNPTDENSFIPALANRIDRNTCGIVIAAKNAEALRILNFIIKQRQIEKYYLCLVQGEPKPLQARLEHFLIKDEKNNTVRIVKNPLPGSKNVITAYRTLEHRKDCSLLEVHLLTGRTHQIRAHLAYIGHPLLGDGKYGKNDWNQSKHCTKQCLCSYKLKFGPFEQNNSLSYLENKEFQLDDIWFVKEYHAGRL